MRPTSTPRPALALLPVLLIAAVGALLGACSQHAGPAPLGYWDVMATLTERFEADGEAAVSVDDVPLSEELREALDTDADGRIVSAELWAHLQESAARPYSGPRDLSEMSGHRAGGFPLNVNPEIVSADEVELGDEDLVMGIVIDGQARAYPVNYMNGPLNEVVNDTLAGEPIASTW